MKSLIVLAASGALAGCAMSSAGLADASVDMTMESKKAPQTVAQCAVDALNDHPRLQSADGHYWFERKNGYGVPSVRWDFRPRADGGTAIEMRTSVPINSGEAKVRECL